MNKKGIVSKGSLYASQVGRFIESTYFSDYRLCTIRFDWSPKRKSSRGGIYAAGPGINIALNWYPVSFLGVGRFYEYKSFDANKVIGGFYYDDPMLKLQAIIVHEMAHTVQFFHYKKHNIKCKPHGKLFKKYYAELREEFINPLLKDQESLRIEYSKIIKDIIKRGSVHYT